MSDPSVQLHDYTEDSYGDQVVALWNVSFPQYHISPPHLKYLLSRDNGRHLVACQPTPVVVGAVFSFVTGAAGHIAAIFVEDGHRRRGIGSALLDSAKITLRDCSDIQIGSIFPRFWPGLPIDVDPGVDAFFAKNGYLSPPGVPLAKDLSIRLDEYPLVSPTPQDAYQEGVTFSPWTPEGYNECMTKQRANFDNTGWVAAYETLASKGLYRQVMVAKDNDGRQVAWTLMIEPNLPVWNELAFPQLLGEKTALIACVGTDVQARKRGIGRALVIAALQDLKARGMKHVFVDWVTLPHFYEDIGFRPWRKYRSCRLEVRQ